MKKIICLFCVLMLSFVSMAAAEETCSHPETEVIGVVAKCENMTDGHCDVETTTSKCLTCGEKIIRRKYGQFVGHVIRYAESLHFSEDGMHLCVFICPDCLCVIELEYACNGDRECLIYKDQVGEQPEVQCLDSLAAWREQNPEAVIVERWLAQHPAE